MKAGGWAIVLVSVLAAAGCATVDPSAPAGGMDPWETVDARKVYAVDLAPRAQASLRPAGTAPEREGYVQLGTIEVTLSEERCFPAGTGQDCSTRAHAAAPTERLLREAARIGGDLVVLSADNARSSRAVSRNGRCLATQQIMQPVQRCGSETFCSSGYEGRRVCFQRTTTCTTSYNPVNVCSSYEKVWGSERVGTSAGTVFRKDPDFALQVRHGDDFAAALRNGDAPKVARLAGEGLRLDIPDLRGRHPLLLAVDSGSLETVSQALARGADPNLERGEPMLRAIQRQNPAVLRALLERGGDPHAGLGFWKQLLTPPGGKGIGQARGRLLQAATETGNPELVRLLLERGADPRAPDDLPLKTAITRRDRTLIDLLVARGASIDAAAGLSAAAQANDLALVQRLLDQGASVDATETGGQTALLHAAAHGNAEMVRLLIARGADVDKRGLLQAHTPLMAAVNRVHEPVVEQLIAAKADLSLRDVQRGLGWLVSMSGHRGNTPLGLALQSLEFARQHAGTPETLARRERIVELLRRAGAPQ